MSEVGWHRAAKLAASWFGLGFLPKAPGTWGTLGALPLWWAMRDLELPLFVGAVALLALVAVGVAEAAERAWGRHDVGAIVIDEVAGVMVAAIGLPFAWPEVVAVVLLFRLFDILKPGPIRWLDRHVRGGLGVVVDDLAAGLAAGVSVHLGRLAWQALGGGGSW